MSKTLTISKDVGSSWKKISSPKPSINYYVTQFIKKPKSLKLFKSGKGGIKELKEILQSNPDKALFGILRVTFFDDKDAPYPKFIYFRFLGSKTPVMTKGQLTPEQGKIDAEFPVKHITYQLDETLNKFDEYYISVDFDRVSENIVQIEYFDFGNGKYVLNKKAAKVGGAKGGGDFEVKDDGYHKTKAGAKKKTGDNNDNTDTKANPLFASLNKGTDITSGLKKVTKDMKTKNQPNRSGKVTSKKSKVVKPKKDPIKKKKGQRLWLEGYYQGLEELKEATLKDEVFVTGCNNCAFKVPNKVKAVTIDSCKKVQIEINEVVSMVEMINSTSCTIYFMDVAPFVNIDKSSNPKLVISQKTLDAVPKILTSMTSDMNVSVPGQTENDDWAEMPVPYQYKVKVDPATGNVETTVIDEH